MELAPTLKLPLTNVSVTAAGTAGFCVRLSEKLSELGADVYTVPHVRIAEYETVPLLDKALEHPEDYGCIAFTGRNGAEIFLRRMRDKGIDIRRLSSAKIAAIGNSTAGYLAGYGLYADIVPEVFTSAGLGKAITEKSDKSKRVLIARAEKGSDDLTDVLDSLAYSYDDIRLYDTVIDHSAVPERVDTDYIVFGSAAGINGFINSGAELSERIKIICIGSVTASAQSRYKNIITASPHTAEGIISAIITEEIK